MPPENQTDQNQGQNNGTPAPGSNQHPQSNTRTFSQDELEAIIKSRLEQERNKYQDYDTLKSAAQKWQEHQDAQKSDMEKLQEELNQARERAEKAESARQTSLIQMAIVQAAAAAGIVDPDAAVKLADLSQVKIGDDGQVSGAIEAVKALAESKPYLLKTSSPPRPTVNPTNPAGAGATLTLEDVKKMSRSEVAANLDAVRDALKK